jgi:hypothetical protein
MGTLWEITYLVRFHMLFKPTNQLSNKNIKESIIKNQIYLAAIDTHDMYVCLIHAHSHDIPKKIYLLLEYKWQYVG